MLRTSTTLAVLFGGLVLIQGALASPVEHEGASSAAQKAAGGTLMSAEEAAEHRAKMRGLSPEEREAYRDQQYAELRERARAKGMELPETPPWKGEASAGAATMTTAEAHAKAMEEAQKAAEKRRAEQQKAMEEAQKAAEKRKAEQQKAMEEAQKAAEKRKAEQQKAMEEAQKAAEKRKAEQQKALEEAQKAAEKRKAEQQKALEEAQKAAE
ncbi:MAG: hypothetical protein PVF91_13405, partial [Chromatiales bacterium]